MPVDTKKNFLGVCPFWAVVVTRLLGECRVWVIVYSYRQVAAQPAA
jgi:hypothetical protein